MLALPVYSTKPFRVDLCELGDCKLFRTAPSSLFSVEGSSAWFLVTRCSIPVNWSSGYQLSQGRPVYCKKGCADELSEPGKECGASEGGEISKVSHLSKGHQKLLITAKHLCAGAVAAIVSRTIIAPLERLKLEYIVRGEQRNLFDLIMMILASQGLKGFWEGNLLNIVRTAPFKAINFYAYDAYLKQLLKMSRNKESTNFERFLAGATSGITATLLCLPVDTIRTKLVAPGGAALGGVCGAFHYMIKSEGFFSLYKGLLPSIISMAPSGAVFYGVYDILKVSYLQSSKGKQRVLLLNQQDQDVLIAWHRLELGPMRTLLYGAIAGICAEAATYPFEVVRRQLQMQARATRMSAMATCAKVVEQGGIQALYAGLIPSLLQVFPSAAISYFVYEVMKIILQVN